MTEEHFVKLENVGEVIAARTLTLLQDGSSASEVLVLLGKPQQLPDHHHDYYCPYQIKGAGVEKARGVYGVDAFQAIQLALSTLGVELEVLNKELGGKLRWECDGKGGLGFPSFLGFP